MSRTNNATRAGLAESALQTFLHQAYGKRTTAQLHSADLRDAIADLIADLGHYADRRFRRRTGFTDLVSRAVGMWSAEREDPWCEPEANHSVQIVIDRSRG